MPSKTDRYAEILVLVVMLFAILGGLAIKQQSQSITWLFESRQAGISVRYPAGWLVQEGGGHIVTVRDPKARPFKTQFIISSIPTSPQTTTRNILDGVTLQRSNDLAAYRVLSIASTTLNGSNVAQVEFAYVDADPNPFIQRLPIVVRGVDLVLITSSRAIVVTFMSDSTTFEADRDQFQRFVASLRY